MSKLRYSLPEAAYAIAVPYQTMLMAIYRGDLSCHKTHHLERSRYWVTAEDVLVYLVTTGRAGNLDLWVVEQLLALASKIPASGRLTKNGHRKETPNDPKL